MPIALPRSGHRCVPALPASCRSRYRAFHRHMSSKRARYDRIAVVEREAQDEDESSEDEQSSEGEDDIEQDDPLQGQQSQQADRVITKQRSIHVALGKPGELVCHVCGQKGHKAGFVGATYMDCPNKPCYLCKGLGHTTATCPHRAVAGAAAVSPGKECVSPTKLLMRREQTGHQRRGALAVVSSPPWQVEAAILKLHSRRVCCLAFPADSDSHVISGDKKGGIAIWNFMRVHDRTTYTNIHRALVNTLKPAPWLPGGYSCASASSDGTVKLFDLETGSSQTLMNLNPGGWSQGCKWLMFYGADVNRELGVVLAGDSDGKVHLLDPRAQGAVNTMQLHKPGSKVNSVAVNPVGGAAVVLTAGNDHTAKLFDVRKLTSIKPSVSNADTCSSSSRPPLPADAAAAAAAANGSAATAGNSSSRRGGKGSTGRRAEGSRGQKSIKRDDSANNSDAEDEQMDNDNSPVAAAVVDNADDAAAAIGRGRGRGRGGRGRGARGSRSSSRGASTAAAAGILGSTMPGSAAAANASTAAVAAGTTVGAPPVARISSTGGGRGRGKSSAVAMAVAAAATAELAVMKHGRVVNAAVFSPSGRKILTTCQDNRLRFWSNLLACDGPPDLEIVHSHDFNRYLSPFRAEWFPSDPSESTIVCGRYISEDFGGVALHPIDIIDAKSGRLLQQLTDLNLNTISPINLPHPRLDIIISGSSRSLYKWTPQFDEQDKEPLAGSLSDAAAAAADLVRRAAAGMSSSFVCVDADPNSGNTKGTGNSKTRGSGTKTDKAAPAGAGTKAKGRGGSKAAAAAAGAAAGGGRGRGRGGGRKRGRGAQVGSDSDNGDSDSD